MITKVIQDINQLQKYNHTTAGLKNSKNLGVTKLDIYSFETHVNDICQSAYAKSRKFANIRSNTS